MSQELVLTDVQDAVMTIRLNRADKKNALTTAMYVGLADALKKAAADSAVRVVLLVGSGGSFCAGNDLVDFLNNPPTDENNSPVMVFMTTLAQFPKPVIAAVTGPAIGVGTTLLLHCDLVYASPKTRFHLTFVNIGICPEFASSLLLPSMIGHQKAAELTLLAEPFDAAKAKECGFVNAVVEEAELEGHARAQALKLAQQPPNALRTTKALLKRWPAATVAEAIRHEGQQFMPMLAMPEAREAMGAFLAKRKPDFSKFS